MEIKEEKNMEPIKWTVVANIEVENEHSRETLHRELDFLTEAEADEWIKENPEYEKIPVYRG